MTNSLPDERSWTPRARFFVHINKIFSWFLYLEAEVILNYYGQKITYLMADDSHNLNDYEILGHNVGVRPAWSSGIRLEREENEKMDKRLCMLTVSISPLHGSSFAEY